MPRYFAFLRAINVGGHTVKMEALRHYFEALGFTRVETFLASGNVIFETPAKQARSLEQQIGECLRVELGYEVAVFIRTEAELAALVDQQPFPLEALNAAQALNVALLVEPPDAAARQKVAALRTASDEFFVQGRAVYWLCRKKQSESKFSNAVLEKTLGQASTLRGFSTLQKLAAKYEV